jgi:SAM-dependent methyltransferase
MGHELSKSMVRRLTDSNFARWYIVGDGIDIGCGMDSIENYTMMLPGMRSVYKYDKLFCEDHDAQTMHGIEMESFDFVHSSHCLEHMQNPIAALGAWWRILRPGGHLIVLVPDEDLYEQGVWPSTFNGDHKSTLTVWKPKSWSPVSTNLLNAIVCMGDDVEIKYIRVCDSMQFRHIKERVDQTKMPNAESSIEFVVRKRLKTEMMLRCAGVAPR